MAVLAEPEVLLLDEPLAGLAESEITGILDVLRRHAGEQTILIVEHKISHVQDFVQRFSVMHEGRIIADGGYEECMRHPEVRRRSYWQSTSQRTGASMRRLRHDGAYWPSGPGVSYGESKVLFDMTQRGAEADRGLRRAQRRHKILLKSIAGFLQARRNHHLRARQLVGARPTISRRWESSTCHRTRKCSPI
jgi:ABC-type multidrug transport system ATPase subunit